MNGVGSRNNKMINLENGKYYWIQICPTEPPEIGQYDSDTNEFMITGVEVGFTANKRKVYCEVIAPDFDKIGIL